MSLLLETNEALADWAASRQQEMGMHTAAHLKAGVYGQTVAETQYDPLKHVGLRPNAFSLTGLATDREYIDLVVPQHPLNINVVLHNDPELDKLPGFLKPMQEYKWLLGNEVRLSLNESLSGLADHAQMYVIGTPHREELLEYGVEVLDDTDEPKAAAEAAAEICAGGLTFVVSDFNNLPLHQVDNADFTDAVAIKTNHPYEIAVPPGHGQWPIKGRKEVNRSKPREIAEADKYLTELHAQRESGLQAAGLTLARTVFSERFPNGLDFMQADQAIADAIYEINKR